MYFILNYLVYLIYICGKPRDENKLLLSAGSHTTKKPWHHVITLCTHTGHHILTLCTHTGHHVITLCNHTGHHVIKLCNQRWHHVITLCNQRWHHVITLCNQRWHHVITLCTHTGHHFIIISARFTNKTNKAFSKCLTFLNFNIKEINLNASRYTFKLILYNQSRPHVPYLLEQTLQR